MKRITHRVPRSRVNVLKLAALGGAGFGLVCGVKADTTITFEGFTADNQRIADLPGYGDNVALGSLDYIVSGPGTPDITLDWVGAWDTYTLWDATRGSVAQSDFNGGPNVSILFTPSAAFAVRLSSFHLDEWSGGGDGNITWSVTGLNSGSLASGNWTMKTGGRSLISPGVTGQLGEGLILNLQLNSGSPSYFALDNLTFAQVPEPSTLALGALGVAAALGAAAMRRRPRA